ncbi:MAG: flagellar motor protein MotB [Lachnospiraceae bacterium]|nr:flagellar motor protein MotB [Lachnospiraceae bacterium]
MAKKKKAEEAPKGSPAWMATFSDLMNLLLCFFVLLFSMSSVDEAKYEELVVSLSNSFSIFTGGGAAIGDGRLISSGVSQLNELDDYYSDMGAASETDEKPNADPMKEYEEQQKEEQKQEMEEMYDELSEMVESKDIMDDITIGMDSQYQYVKISLSGAILFDSGKAEVVKGAKPILSKIGDILKVYDDSLIKIEGHTDNVPTSAGSKYADNMELSTARAISVWNYFVHKKGLSPKTLEASGRSQYNPIASNKTAEGRAKNRRVEIKIYKEDQK